MAPPSWFNLIFWTIYLWKIIYVGEIFTFFNYYIKTPKVYLWKLLNKFKDLEKKASKSGNTYSINLNDINIQKVLGKGEINKRINITVKNASKRAVEKIEAAGGNINLLSEIK